MTHTQALEALRDKVAAGEYPVAWRAFGGDERILHFVHNAHNGSLDAAKALHETVLGDGYAGEGFKYMVWGNGCASVWNVITDERGGGRVDSPELHAVAPARAWLLAILKALIAQSKEAGND